MTKIEIEIVLDKVDAKITLPPVENTIENSTTSPDGKWNDGDIRPFEVKVPPNAMIIYTGVYSKH